MASGADPGGDAPEPATEGRHDPAQPSVSDVPGGAALLRVTRLLALVGGALLLVATGISVVSITGRYAFGSPVPGDYELVELICAVAVFLFFPFTHALGANLTAEFFTSGLPRRWRAVLDVVHDAIFTLVAALLAWRLGAGMLDKVHNGDSSLLLEIPLWWPYAVAVACMWLLSAVSLWRAAAGVKALRR